MKRFLLASALITASMVTSIAPAQAQWAMTCTREHNSSVNLRRGPGRNFPVIASIPNGSYVRLLSWVWGADNMKWYRVETSGIVGFSRQDFLCG